MRIMGLIVPPFILHVTARSNRTGATKQSYGWYSDQIASGRGLAMTTVNKKNLHPHQGRRAAFDTTMPSGQVSAVPPGLRSQIGKYQPANVSWIAITGLPVTSY